MATQITLTYCGVEATGRTVKEAKQVATRRVERFAETGPAPEIIKAGDYAALIFRDLQYGWEYRMICSPDGGLTEGRIYGCNGNDDRKETERAARRHLADLATDWRNCYSAKDVHHVCTDDHDRKEIALKCAWNRRYTAYKARGFNDNECHHLASQFGDIVGCQQIAECDAA